MADPSFVGNCHSSKGQLSSRRGSSVSQRPNLGQGSPQKVRVSHASLAVQSRRVQIPGAAPNLLVFLGVPDAPLKAISEASEWPIARPTIGHLFSLSCDTCCQREASKWRRGRLGKSRQKQGDSLTRYLRYLVIK